MRTTIIFVALIAVSTPAAAEPDLDCLPPIAAPPGFSWAQQRTFTDRNGRYQGSASQHGNATTFTDPRGHFSGSSITDRDGTTRYFDERGRYVGSSKERRR